MMRSGVVSGRCDHRPGLHGLLLGLCLLLLPAVMPVLAGDDDRLQAARTALEQHDPLEALRHLPLESHRLSPPLVLQSLDIRAQAEAALGRHLDAITTWNRAHALAEDAASRSWARQQLMRWLEGLGTAELRALRSRASSPDTVQWLDEALRLRGIEPPSAARVAVAPARPAVPISAVPLPATVADMGTSVLQRTGVAGRVSPPRRIAVILPLTGRYGSVARGILQGIEAAHEDAGLASSVVLRLHDMGEDAGNVLRHYEEAVREGADLVIGPLSREAVDRLAARPGALPVPVLALNHSEGGGHYPAHFFRFGLNPEDEAVEVAQRAFAQGYRRAVVIVPRTALGERLQVAFRARFEALGGEVRSVQTFPHQATDFGDAIPVGVMGGGQGRGRRDVDMVFISGEPRHARLIVSQLRLHQAGDLPVFATSHVFSGRMDPGVDRDMEGVLVADMPWLLGQTGPRAGLETSLDASLKRWPRMAAFGYDAYRLGMRLGTLQQGGGERLHGLTGTLTVDDQGRVHRTLEWARFVDGSPRVISGWRQ